MKSVFFVTAFTSALAQDSPTVSHNYDDKCLQCIYEGNSFCVADNDSVNSGITIDDSKSCIGLGETCEDFSDLNMPLNGFEQCDTAEYFDPNDLLTEGTEEEPSVNYNCIDLEITQNNFANEDFMSENQFTLQP